MSNIYGIQVRKNAINILWPKRTPKTLFSLFALFVKSLVTPKLMVVTIAKVKSIVKTNSYNINFTYSIVSSFIIPIIILIPLT
ncbi:hypothetical protein V7161_05575, partial [Neobacillus drentensis]